MARKHPKIWSNNPPKIDWIRIIWKCQERFEWPSLAESFAHQQCLDFAVEELKQLNIRRDSGSVGHKNPHKEIHRHCEDTWPDLRTDDPLYDGEIIF